METQIVVARYNENVDWTLAHSNVLVYNKGENNINIPHHVIDLPNVGRETHTYLYHIIHNYDNLADYTVFTQGQYADHISEDSFKLILQPCDCSSNLFDSTLWGCYASTYDFRIRDYRDHTVTPNMYNETYGQWYERLLKKPFPHQNKHVFANGIFGVSRNRIHMYSKDMYETLIKEVDSCQNPETGHFFERTWSKLFIPE